MHRCRFLLRTGVALASGLAAVAAHPTDRPDPSNPAASTPRVVHESTFKHYRRFGETSVASWQQANETVARVGGWRAYAREAQAPQPAPSASAAAAPARAAPPAGAAPGGHKH